MEWLNYHHLYYFWRVVRSGGISGAARELQVSSPAVSAQIKELEGFLGEPLFARSGRTLVMTNMGRIVYDYAEDIFSLGRELLDTVRNRPTGRPIRIDIGVADVLPKMIAQWLIEPALKLRESVRIVCREASSDQLVAKLASLELDVVLSDSPADPDRSPRAFNHLLGESGVTFVGMGRGFKRTKQEFPECLSGIPMLLPTDNTTLGRDLQYWFSAKNVYPQIVGEFEDYALLQAFAQSGSAAFPVPSVFVNELRKQHRLVQLGSSDDVKLRFYAISSERKIKHPAVAAICESARRQLFNE